jgi:dihydropteroate synthase
MIISPGSRTLIMGILNITPDSFHDGGRYQPPEKAVERAFQIRLEGADILDIGGESTRPGANPVSAQEEMERVCPVVEKLAGNLDMPISVDTRKSAVAEAVLRAGASMINDTSALSFDENMAGVVARHGASIVLMHMKGTPETMQENPSYRDVTVEVCDYLRERSRYAVEHGIEREKIIVDPGIGFGKTVEHNYEIIVNLSYFKRMGFPLLIGLSRKSLIGKLYPEGTERLPATLALNAIAVNNGADIIRVHDVRAHRLALTALEMVKKAPKRNGSGI